ERVLGKSHGVADHRRAGISVNIGEPLDVAASNAARALNGLPRKSGKKFLQLFEALGVLADECGIRLPLLDQYFHHPVDKCNVAAYAHLEEVVHQLGSEDGTGCD